MTEPNDSKLKPHGGPAEEYPYANDMDIRMRNEWRPVDTTKTVKVKAIVPTQVYDRQLLREFCDLIAEYGSSNPIEHYQELADNLLAKRRRP